MSYICIYNSNDVQYTQWTANVPHIVVTKINVIPTGIDSRRINCIKCKQLDTRIIFVTCTISYIYIYIWMWINFISFANTDYFYKYGLRAWVKAWIMNHFMAIYKMQSLIPTLQVTAVYHRRGWACMSNYYLLFYVDEVTYPCPNVDDYFAHFFC